MWLLPPHHHTTAIITTATYILMATFRWTRLFSSSFLIQYFKEI